MGIFKGKPFLLFLCLFIHVFVLNLFYVSTSGLFFYWQENTTPLAFIVYISIALLSVAFYLLVVKWRAIRNAGRIKVNEKAWLLLSMVLMVFIGYLLI